VDEGLASNLSEYNAISSHLPLINVRGILLMNSRVLTHLGLMISGGPGSSFILASDTGFDGSANCF